MALNKPQGLICHKTTKGKPFGALQVPGNKPRPLALLDEDAFPLKLNCSRYSKILLESQKMRLWVSCVCKDMNNFKIDINCFNFQVNLLNYEDGILDQASVIPMVDGGHWRL